jgi:two-component system sensor histidine kinase/response regulator
VTTSLSDHNVLASYNVLVVDDNQAIHHDVRTLLSSNGGPDDLDALASEVLGTECEQNAALPVYHLDSAYQGEDAVLAVRQGLDVGHLYALALVDMRMPPGWDGVKTIQRIWELDSDMQITICSAYSDYAWEDIVHELGVSDKLLFLRKPFDPYALRQLVLSQTTRWQREREVRTLIRAHEHLLESYETELRELRKHMAGEPVQDLLIQAAQRTMSNARRAVASESVEIALDALMDLLQALNVTQLSHEQRPLGIRAIRLGSSLRSMFSTARDTESRH